MAKAYNLGSVIGPPGPKGDIGNTGPIGPQGPPGTLQPADRQKIDNLPVDTLSELDSLDKSKLNAPQDYPTPTATAATLATDKAIPRWTGKTTVTGTPSWDNPATLAGRQFKATASGGGKSNTVEVGVGYSLPDGVADGYRDGVLTRRVVRLELDGTEVFESATASGGQVYYKHQLTHLPAKAGNTLYCTHFKPLSTNVPGTTYISSDKTYVYFFPTKTYPTAAAFAADLAAEKAAGRPVTVLYELATPATIRTTADLTCYAGTTALTGADGYEVVDRRNGGTDYSYKANVEENTLPVKRAATQAELDNILDNWSSGYPDGTRYQGRVNIVATGLSFYGGMWNIDGGKRDANYEWQKATKYGGSSSQPGIIELRSKVDGVWTDWEPVAWVNKNTLPVKRASTQAELDNVLDNGSSGYPSYTKYQWRIAISVPGGNPGTGTWNIDGFKADEIYEWQQATQYGVAAHPGGAIKFRTKSKGVWTDWEPVAWANKNTLPVKRAATQAELDNILNNWSEAYPYSTLYQGRVGVDVSSGAITAGTWDIEGSKNSVNFEWQKATKYGGSSSQPGIIELRSKVDGVWTDWSPNIVPEVEMPPVTDITRRNTYRGKNLGTSVTAGQKAAIRSSTFTDLWLGDYWEINNVKWRIADINYWMNCGDTNFTTPHLVIMPDTVLYSAKMNETDITTGGYVGSKMYTEGLNQAKTMAASAFPSMVLTHRTYLVNAATDGKPSAGAWVDSSVELPNEIMMYGSYIFTPAADGKSITNRYTIGNSQLALMQQVPRFIKTRETYWLRDVVSAAYFARVYGDGGAGYGGASGSVGVRPVFFIG